MKPDNMTMEEFMKVPVFGPYKYQAYPKVKYHPTHAPITVHSVEEDAQFFGWEDKPPQNPDAPASLSEADRKAHLLQLAKQAAMEAAKKELLEEAAAKKGTKVKDKD